jgi:HD-GYP domain-containing protein (c-di-GMP phosphodiesterase class II)
MLENIPGLEHVLEIVLHHHETWEGKGFPSRLKGVNIPIGARIVAVADYYDMFINPCTQNWQKSHDDAAKELRKYAGTRFDPEVVKAFFSVLTNSKNAGTRKLTSSKENIIINKKERSS